MTEPEASGGGYSIFEATMADMTWPEVERAARQGAVLLWGLGVIEEHGPHLPLGTDVYLPAATLKRTRRLLADRGVQALVIPPFYWGINSVTGGFPGSFTVRPATMIEFMLDVFQSVRKDGFETVFCLSGHGDALHNRTMAEGIRRGRVERGVRAYFVLTTALFERLGFRPDDPQFLTIPFDPPRGPYVDVHAGNGETSMMWGCYPEFVKTDVIRTLKSTDLGVEDLEEWRQGWSNARRKTPLGYLGDPAAASPERGRQIIDRQVALVTEAIVKKLEGRSP